MSGASPPAPAAAATLAGPHRYGRYILVDRLGAGGMAEVFRALVIGPEQFQRIVVVKRILPHLSEDPNFVRMFISEATICGRLNHPNIIHVHEFGKVDGHYFIAMEYVQGRTLNSTLGRLANNQTFMPPTIAADIARQACLGLSYAHDLTGVDGKPLGVVHRDVTPSNVMVAYAGGVKVLDFGIARVASEIRGDTDVGKVKGKSSYLAPEQIEPDGRIDRRVDVFATGIILHEALTCRRLFKASAPLETMRLIRSMEIPRPSSINPDIPAALDDIVTKALSRDPEGRYQTAGDMADALEAFLVEKRYASQDLPKWLRSLFGQELTAELEIALPQREIAALMEGMPLDQPVSRPTPTPTPALTTMEFSETETPSVMPARAAVETAFDGDVALDLPRRWPRALMFAALAVALAGGIVLWAGRGRAPARATVEAAAVPPPPPPVPAAPPAPPPLSPHVAISVTSEPTDVVVTDVHTGAELGRTPFVLKLSRGTNAVELAASSPGHIDKQVDVVPDTDKPLLITLAKAPKVKRPGPVARPGKPGNIRNAVPLDPFAP